MKTIIDNMGNKIEITNFDAALEQAETSVKLHKMSKKSGVLYFEDAHKRQVHILKQLKTLKQL